MSGLDRNVFQSINFFISQKFSFEWMYISVLMCFIIKILRSVTWIIITPKLVNMSSTFTFYFRTYQGTIIMTCLNKRAVFRKTIISSYNLIDRYNCNYQSSIQKSLFLKLIWSEKDTSPYSTTKGNTGWMCPLVLPMNLFQTETIRAV